MMTLTGDIDRRCSLSYDLYLLLQVDSDSDNNNDDTNEDIERRCSLSYDSYLLLQVDSDNNNIDTNETSKEGVLYLTIYSYFFR